MNMPLPQLAVPSFPITIPSTKQKIIMRSMTTKEFKLFLIAKEGNDKNQILHTIYTMIGNCIDSDVDLKTLPMYDIEYLFIQLYVNSTAENKKIIPYRCKNIFEDKECGKEHKVTFNLADAEVDFSKVTNPNPYYEINIKSIDGQDVILKFNRPDYNSFTQDDDSDFTTIANCLTTVATKDQMWQKNKDFDIEVAKKYVEGIDSIKLERIIKFFYEIPELKIKENFTCSKCGFEHEISLNGIQDFF